MNKVIEIKKETAEQKAKNKIAALTTIELCGIYEIMNLKENTNEIIMVRGWVMDELEKRSKEIFNSWIDCENVEDMDKPSKFFLVK